VFFYVLLFWNVYIFLEINVSPEPLAGFVTHGYIAEMAKRYGIIHST